jgi:leucyl/phenylalanyl-tRNA--protein transferase
MPPRFFPPPTHSTPDGLVSIGAELSCERLLDAYRHGIFPWPVYAEDPMLWWSPNPRAILPLGGMHISKRLGRRLRSGEFQATCDQAFSEVIRNCSAGTGREGGTWLTEEMIDAYCDFHLQGHAHSVEVWQNDRLVGGVYGVTVGGLFSAESMFYQVRDASKVAVARLVQHLNARGYQMLDVQQWTPHTGSLGVVEIPREEYLLRIAEVVDLPVTFGANLETQLIE